MSITLHGPVADIIQEQFSAGTYQSPENLVYKALESLFKNSTEKGINEGIADIKSGRSMPLTSDNIHEVLSKPISQW